MAGLRDPFRYRKEAAQFRARANAVTDSPLLRDSYLALATEFERLADILERGAETARKSVHSQDGNEVRSQS